MLYREIIAVCSEIHTKHTDALCGQNVELLNVILAVHIGTTELQRVRLHSGVRSNELAGRKMEMCGLGLKPNIRSQRRAT